MEDRNKYDFGVIKANISLAEVLRSYGLEIKYDVVRQTIRCPFHDDRNPSMELNFVKNVFNCFRCGAHGTVLDFVMQKEGCSLNEAARILGDTYLGGIDKIKPITAKPEVIKNEIEYYLRDKDKAIYKRLYELSPLSSRGRNYLINQRGFDNGMLEMAHLGAIENPMGVFDNLKKDFDVTELDHAGLLYYGKNNLIYFMGGLLIFYRMGDEIVYVNQRKYPGSKGVKYNGLMGKAKHFYCLNPESDVLTVVEGEIDALAFCHITGSDKVIACGGVVNARPRKLDNYLAQMCYGKKRKYQFVLDSDEAGAKTVKALKEAGEIAMTVDEYCIDYGIGAGYKDFGEVLERKAAMDRAG